MCVKMIKRHSLPIITIRTKSTHREEIDFSCKQTNETNEFYLGSLAILGHEVVPTSLIVKKDTDLILQNEVHIICWQAFSMTSVVVLWIF